MVQKETFQIKLAESRYEKCWQKSMMVSCNEYRGLDPSSKAINSSKNFKPECPTSLLFFLRDRKQFLTHIIADLYLLLANMYFFFEHLLEGIFIGIVSQTVCRLQIVLGASL